MNLSFLAASNLRLASALLRLAGGFHSPLRDLYLKLEDIRAYLAGDGLFQQGSQVSHVNKARFNGRIAYAAHSLGYFHTSGYAARTSSLLAALQQCGVSVCGVVRPGYPRDINPNLSATHSSSVDYRGISYQINEACQWTIRSPDSEYIEAYAAWLADVARQHRVSVIHAASNYLNGSAAALAGKQLGLPSVYEVRGLWHLTRASEYPRYRGSDHFRYCEKREVDTCFGVDHVIVLSDGLKPWLVSRGVPAGKISVVGNAADRVEETAELVEATRRLRLGYGLEMGRPVVGYIGSVVTYEGLSKLIRLLARTPVGARPYLLIAGDGPARPGLQKMAHRLGVADAVLLVGRISAEQVSAHYGVFDVAALPREDSELTRLVPPLKPFEILAHGCPLVVSEPVASAIGSTLGVPVPTSDFDSLDTMNDLIDLAQGFKISPGTVPTWDKRAQDTLSIYRQLG